ncbi:MAG TPA: isoprenylcysteine carboxylmethyltransferase family protein [Acidimicrobiales bacterium]|nr:isoprenylcysteine carboxylmethyltransferase family protein [Acidimicrobiales bacterium]
MRVIDVVITVVWVVFWLYWLAASFGAKATQTRSRSSAMIRILIVIIVITAARAGLFKGHTATIDNPWLEGFGLAVFLAGLGLAVWARAYLGRNWGMPMSEKVDPELVTTGPYRFVRHPIYSGIILAMIGTTMAVTLYWLGGVVLLGGYFVYSATVEERNMELLFPDAYGAYKRRTKMLIPFVF